MGGNGRPAHAVQSVDRALDLLEALAEADRPVGVSELATATSLPFGTAHRLLRSLVARGYARQDSDRKYAPGAVLFRLGSVAQRSMGRSARPYLARLVELSGETANLAVRDGDQVVYLAQAPSPHALRMFAEVGRHVHAHCTAVGKVLLADLSADERDGVVGRAGLPRRTDTTITRPEVLGRELERVRSGGFALDNGEEEPGVRCVAVPVGEPGAVIASLSVSGPTERMQRVDLGSLVPRMRRVADEFAAAFGACRPADAVRLSPGD
ncbi:MAG: IclR family transcriptional regulator, acetate operon repressor [Actinomycetota bacterium]|nr:IclR family transcriptional regulator, acetate operon repressor [Actinomycetota bacterium]